MVLRCLFFHYVTYNCDIFFLKPTLFMLKIFEIKKLNTPLEIMLIMLLQKTIDGALTFDALQWLAIPANDLKIIAHLVGKLQKYSKGMRILSISDNSELEFKDSAKEPCVFVFKRGSLVAYENGSLFYKDEDVLSINPNI